MRYNFEPFEIIIRDDSFEMYLFPQYSCNPSINSDAIVRALNYFRSFKVLYCYRAGRSIGLISPKYVIQIDTLMHSIDISDSAPIGRVTETDVSDFDIIFNQFRDVLNRPIDLWKLSSGKEYLVLSMGIDFTCIRKYRRLSLPNKLGGEVRDMLLKDVNDSNNFLRYNDGIYMVNDNSVSYVDYDYYIKKSSMVLPLDLKSFDGKSEYIDMIDKLLL